jgi:hypothetical protein
MVPRVGEGERSKKGGWRMEEGGKEDEGSDDN